MRVLKGVFTFAAILVLSGCGSTSALVSSQTKQMPNLSSYNEVAVLDFKDGTNRSFKDEGKTAAYHEEVLIAGRNFADRIAVELKKTEKFDAVLREEKEGEGVLIISGEVVRYVEGNAAARLFIGLGAGSSYFDANVKFRDGMTQQLLGEIKVDKNSWFLGGGLAAGQTVENFMAGAAEKIASETAIAKGNGPIEVVVDQPKLTLGKEEMPLAEIPKPDGE